jgi:ABC-type transport system involved in Fe-S cluster assembly fused permease/ATPase subunit
MYKLIDVIEFLLQSSFRNPIECYNRIVILSIMYDVWWLGSILWAVFVFLYFDIKISKYQMLALTSLTSGGRSVGVVRLRTEATEFFFTLC